MPVPFFQIFAGGADVTSKLAGGGISLTINDGVGLSSDTAQIEIDDKDGVVAAPRTGVELRIVAGYVDQPVDFGVYIVDEVEYSGWPQRITINASAAKAKSPLKQRRPKSYEPPDYPTYRKIFDEVAGRNGLQLSISAEIGSKSVEYEAQAEEDDAAFLMRLGQKLDASISVKNNRLIAVKRGAGSSAGGQPLPTIKVIGGVNALSYMANRKDQPKYQKAKATWFDRQKVERKEVEAPAGGDGPELLLREPYQSEGEAKDAATAAGKEAKRGEGTASFAIDGDPTARAEAYVIVTRIRSMVDGTWRATSVSHQWSSTGPYTTTIECELPG